MANVTIGGFRAVGTLSGGLIPHTLVRPVVNNYATQLNKGDFLISAADGTVGAGTAGSTTNLVGVAVGFSYIQSGGPVSGRRVVGDFLPANTTFSPTTVGSPQESLCEYIPATADIIWEVDCNGTTVNTVAGRVGLIGENCNLVVTGTPSTTVGNSCMFLDDSTHNTTAQQFRVIGIPGYTLEGGLDITQASAGDPTLSHFRLLVVLNQGFLPPYTTTGI